MTSKNVSVFTIGLLTRENTGKDSFEVVRIGKIWGGFHPCFTTREKAEEYKKNFCTSRSEIIVELTLMGE